MKKYLVSLLVLTYLFAFNSCGKVQEESSLTPNIEKLPTEAPHSDGPPQE